MIRRSLQVIVVGSVLASASACGTSDAGAPAARDLPEDRSDVPGAIEEAFDVAVGDCFDLAGSLAQQADPAAAIEQVRTVPCDEPHDNEAFHAFELDDGPFPGREVVMDLAEEGCGPPFTTFVGDLTRIPNLAIYLLYPTEESWAEGDRAVTCAAFDQRSEKLTGSVGAG